MEWALQYASAGLKADEEFLRAIEQQKRQAQALAFATASQGGGGEKEQQWICVEMIKHL